jgi:hypothetical protein
MLATHGALIESAFASATTLNQFLVETGYYHVLYLTPTDWRALPQDMRQRYASRVTLIIFGPEPLAEADLIDVKNSLYFRTELAVEVAVALLDDFHRCLQQGMTLGQCAEASSGLAFVGDEACWPIPASVGPSITTVTNRSGGVDLTGIGTVNVSGDVVGHDKIVNVMHEYVAGSKIVQQAGGDQINVNPLASTASETSPAVDEGQVVHRAERGKSTKKSCLQCGQMVEASEQICANCGHKLT